MNKSILDAVSEDVTEVQRSGARLAEKTLQMRCLAYMSKIKSQLLMETISDLNWNRKILNNLSQELAQSTRKTETQKEIIENQKRYFQRQLRADREIADKKLRESDQRLQDFLDKLQDVVWIMNPDSGFFYINNSCLKVFGLPVDSFQGSLEVWRSIIHPEDAEKVIAESETLQEQGRVHQQYRIIHQDGSVRWLDDRRHCIADDEGKLRQIGGIIRDITQRKRAENALRRAHKMEAVGQITGGIAHDFNNILTVIQGNIDLLGFQIGKDDRSFRQLAAIRKATKRAGSLTEQLLGFSRNKAERQVVSNLNILIEEMGWLIKRTLTDNIHFDYRLAADLWLTEVDHGDFENALLNMVLNARDALQGSGSVLIRTENCTLDEGFCQMNPGSVPGDFVTLIIQDSGEGISEENQDQIFEPFFTTKRQGKGSGLGLAMVFGFVKRSRGYITVESQPNSGTTFKIYLPKSHSTHCPDNPSGHSGTTSSSKRETILVVDDEEFLLELEKEQLLQLGYEVLTASSGAEALNLLKTNASINLLFSDVVMPGGINGYELAVQATKLKPDLKILLTSGNVNKSTLSEAQKPFAARQLNKPYSHVQLARRIRQELDA